MFFNICNNNLFIYLGHGWLRYSSPKCTMKVCCLTQTIHNQVKTNSSNQTTGAKRVAQGPMHMANPSILENLAYKVNSPHEATTGARKFNTIKETIIRPQIFHDDWFSEDSCTLFGLEGRPQLRPQGLHPDPLHFLKQ